MTDYSIEVGSRYQVGGKKVIVTWKGDSEIEIADLGSDGRPKPGTYRMMTTSTFSLYLEQMNATLL